jgi:hypothetical protein
LYANVAALLSIMAEWKPPRREPPKTKTELREMLTKAVRNTQPDPKPKHPPKGKSGAVKRTLAAKRKSRQGSPRRLLSLR